MNEEKDFYGAVSVTARVKFNVKGKDIEEATKRALEGIQGIEFVMEEGSTMEVAEVDWSVIEEDARGNVSPPHVSSFDIEQEKE
jgi:hypothetical protein